MVHELLNHLHARSRPSIIATHCGEHRPAGEAPRALGGPVTSAREHPLERWVTIDRHRAAPGGTGRDARSKQLRNIRGLR